MSDWKPWIDGGHILDEMDHAGVHYTLHVQKITLPPQVWTVTVFKGVPKDNSVVARVQFDAPAGKVDVLAYLRQELQKLFNQLKTFFAPSGQNPVEQWERIEALLQEMRFDRSTDHPQIKMP